MNILFHFDVDPALQAEIDMRAGDDLTIDSCAQDDDEAFYRLLPQTDVLWHVLRPVSAADIARAPRLKLIQKIGVGVNTIDVEAAHAAGIRVANMPGTNTRAVAEMTLMLMLAALRRLPQLDRLVRAGGWAVDHAVRGRLGELAGRTVGLVGFGGVAETLAPILELMGARVIYTSRTLKDVPYEHVALDALLARADVVSLHLPLTGQTEGLLDAGRIAQMKPGAVLINTARGQVVDEASLYTALASGHLSAAGLDVFADEPVTPDNRLLELENVVLAPHAAWLTLETLKRSLDVAIANARAIAAGTALSHEIP